MRPLVIVGCGATKHPTRTSAGDMYQGNYHRACRRAAQAHTTSDRTLILSALHGLLDLDQVIDPYDLRMGECQAVAADQVRHQATARGLLDEPDVIVFGGAAYTRVVTAVWPHAHAPLAGTGGMGKQLAVLKQLTLRASYTPPLPGPDLIRPGLQVEAVTSFRATGGRYGGVLQSVGPTTAVVDCFDGVQRRFRHEQLQVNDPGLLLDAWNHLGYINPDTGRTTTSAWHWWDWTLTQHLTHRGAPVDRPACGDNHPTAHITENRHASSSALPT
ncbi:MAG: hypothetical protein L0H93_15395 [Nocardioides sp.]|nr:hypothetical protein [Nocardioides sp.]